MINPFVFEKRVKIAIISYKASTELKKLLDRLQIKIVETLPLNSIGKHVNDHPDMLVHPVDYSNIVVYKDHYEYDLKKLNGYGINVIPSECNLEEMYPKDVLLNVSRVGKYYFYKKNCIDLSLEKELRNDYKPININQGYAKCSTMILKENTVVTTDLKLHRKYLELNLKSYLLPFGHIDLPGYSTGFIGGTCGNIGQDELLFYGNLEKYKFYKELKKILSMENIKYHYPKTDSFIDRGSIIGILGG